MCLKAHSASMCRCKAAKWDPTVACQLRSALKRQTFPTIWRHLTRSSLRCCHAPSTAAEITHQSRVVSVTRARSLPTKWEQCCRSRTHRVKSVIWRWRDNRVYLLKFAQRTLMTSSSLTHSRPSRKIPSSTPTKPPLIETAYRAAVSQRENEIFNSSKVTNWPNVEVQSRAQTVGNWYIWPPN